MMTLQALSVSCAAAMVAGCALAMGGCKAAAPAADAGAPSAGPRFDPDLYRGAERGNRARVEHRLDDGAQINAPSPENGWTALHAAAYNGHKKLVAFMLTRGADAGAQDNEGNTPLHLAASRGHYETTAALMAVSDLNQRNRLGKTAHEMATPTVGGLFPR